MPTLRCTGEITRSASDMDKQSNIIRPSLITVLLCLYFVWNLFFLVQKEVPPSIFKYFTGFPCATSGGIRSIKCLFNGEYKDFFYFNPFTCVFMGLFLISMWKLFLCFIRKQSKSLPHWLGITWLITLGCAWIVKFILPSQYW